MEPDRNPPIPDVFHVLHASPDASVVRESPDAPPYQNDPTRSPDPTRGRGRPPLLDNEKRAVVLALIAVGCSQRRAAQFVGVTESIIRYAGRNDSAFRADLQKARATTEYECMSLVREAGARSWRAATWCLERVFPKRYNLRPRPKPQPPRPMTGQEIHQFLLDQAEQHDARLAQYDAEDDEQHGAQELEDQPRPRPRKKRTPAATKSNPTRHRAAGKHKPRPKKTRRTKTRTRN